MGKKVKLIEVDGYEDWAPCNIKDIEVEEFTAENIALAISDGETSKPSDLGGYVGRKMKKGVISILHEEGGWHAILME